jgi:hypothetical protein
MSADYLDLPPDDITTANPATRASRQRRGPLGSNGDNRSQGWSSRGSEGSHASPCVIGRDER